MQTLWLGLWRISARAEISAQFCRAEISVRLPKQIFLKTRLQLHEESFNPGRITARAEIPARFLKPGWKSQPGQTGWKTSCNRVFNFSPGCHIIGPLEMVIILWLVAFHALNSQTAYSCTSWGHETVCQGLSGQYSFCLYCAYQWKMFCSCARPRAGVNNPIHNFHHTSRLDKNKVDG